MVRDALNGIDTCAFVYGQPFAGKRYTAVGSGGAAGEGLLLRFIDSILDPRSVGGANCEVPRGKLVELSALIVYNESLTDAFAPRQAATQCDLRIRRREDGSVWVPGLTWIPLKNSAHARQVLQSAAKVENLFNVFSQRSHDVYQVRVTTCNASSELGTVGVVRQANAMFVRCAGSERIPKTGLTNVSPVTALQRVIRALSDRTKNDFVPVRDSQLTYLMSSCFVGGARTAIVGVLSPHPSQHEEAERTLRFLRAATSAAIPCDSRSMMHKCEVRSDGLAPTSTLHCLEDHVAEFISHTLSIPRSALPLSAAPPPEATATTESAQPNLAPADAGK